MLVARPRGRGFRVIDSFSRIVRLGEGLSTNGTLGEAAIERTVEALNVCAGKIRARNVSRVRSVATEACRQAGNCREFVDRVKAETGLDLKPITPTEESHLTLAGCAPLLDERRPFALVFDIGGGSTELMWIEQAPGRPPRCLALLSLPVGVLTLAERFGSEAISPSVHAEIVGELDGALAPFDGENGIAREIERGRVQMLGTSGTVTTLGGIHLDLPRYMRSRVDGLEIGFDRIAELTARLSAMDRAARAAHPCITDARADLVAVGCALLDAICARWPVGRLRIADRGIREGLLMAMMDDEGRTHKDVEDEGDSAPS